MNEDSDGDGQKDSWNAAPEKVDRRIHGIHAAHGKLIDQHGVGVKDGSEDDLLGIVWMLAEGQGIDDKGNEISEREIDTGEEWHGLSQSKDKTAYESQASKQQDNPQNEKEDFFYVRPFFRGIQNKS